MKERITHSFSLAPFPPEDIYDYLNFRLRAVGYRGPDLFTQKTAAIIKKYSNGLTRRINILADKALLAAYAEGRYEVLPKDIVNAAIDSEFAEVSNGKEKSWLKITALAASVLLVSMTILYAGIQLGSQPYGMNLQHYLRTTGQQETGKHSTSNSLASSSLIHGAGNLPATESWQSDNEVMRQKVPAAVAGKLSAKKQSLQVAKDVISVADEGSGQTFTQLRVGEHKIDRLDERVIKTRQWLASANEGNYSIQLFMARQKNRQALEAFLEQLPKDMDESRIYIYPARIKGDDWYCVVYDEYASFRQANSRLKTLPESMHFSAPYLRRLSAVKKEATG